MLYISFVHSAALLVGDTGWVRGMVRDLPYSVENKSAPAHKKNQNEQTNTVHALSLSLSPKGKKAGGIIAKAMATDDAQDGNGRKYMVAVSGTSLCMVYLNWITGWPSVANFAH